MIGRTLSHYRILAKVGAGGMGVIYRAEDLRLGRQVAMKLLPETMAADPQALERIRREARAASSLQHPNICTIFDVDEHEGIPFIVMELLEGEPLSSRLAAGPLPPETLIDMAIAIADALDTAHEGGVIHRDIKPSNIFVTQRGEPKLMDFGLAKMDGPAGTPGHEASALPTAAEDNLTRPGTTVGTIQYMSPEQARGVALDRRTDIFSFGAVLYEMATGQRPFGGQTSAVIFDAILNRDPRAPGALNPDLPEGLAHVIDKALEKDRELRYQTAAEMRADMKRLRRDTSSARTGVAPVAATEPRPQRRLVPAVAAVAVTAALIAAAAWWATRAPAPDGSPATTSTSLAVLPFQNLGADPRLDFLRFALPDEVANVLSYAPSLSIRPLAATRRFSGEDVDPQAAGRELEVSRVLAGHFLQEAGTLRVTVEVIDTEANRLLWRDTLGVPSDDLIAMRASLSGRLRQGLLPALGVPTAATDTATQPADPEAYGLYLRATALETDAQPTKQAIPLLERAVALDPSFAPAWAELGHRLYLNASYSDGGRPEMERATDCYERALRLDPRYVRASGGLVGIAVEGGELARALRESEETVRSSPDSANAWFSRSYVLRYAGRIEESARACDRAVSLDPGNRAWRSCALTFIELGDYAHARDFVRLDAGSQWAALVESDILIHEGQPARAFERLTSVQELFDPAMLSAQRHCLGPSPEPIPPAVVSQVEERFLAGRDSEPLYFQSGRMAYCGMGEAALRLLRAAVERNYLPYPAMDHEPLFDSIRGTAEFAAIRDLAMKKQQEIAGQR